ncbi:MAG TPA: hypothetical protein VNV62_09710 [Trebonia sp.]|nr:hypothetical protein [Trebonia sp.]
MASVIASASVLNVCIVRTGPNTSSCTSGIDLSWAVQPAARAGASERMPSATGEFHGAMMPATPTGWRTTRLSSSSLTWLLVPVSVNASAALNRSVSGANATSSLS